MPTQTDLFGDAKFVGDALDKAQHILEVHGDARNNYTRAVLHWWLDLDGLREALGEDAANKLLDHAGKLTAVKTIWNRVQDVQNSTPELDASPDVEKWRKRQARAGRVV